MKTADMVEATIELLEAYVICPEEELSEDAIERIRKPILKVLKPLLGIEKQEIKTKILTYLDSHNKAKVPEIAKHLGVERKHILSALKELEDEGLVREDI